MAELVEQHPSLGVDALALLEPGVAVTRRISPGGAGPGPMRQQLERFVHRLAVDGERLSSARQAAGLPGDSSSLGGSSGPGGSPGSAGPAALPGSSGASAAAARG